MNLPENIYVKKTRDKYEVTTKWNTKRLIEVIKRQIEDHETVYKFHKDSAAHKLILICCPDAIEPNPTHTEGNLWAANYLIKTKTLKKVLNCLELTDSFNNIEKYLE